MSRFICCFNGVHVKMPLSKQQNGSTSFLPPSFLEDDASALMPTPKPPCLLLSVSVPHRCSEQTSHRTIGQATEQMEIQQHAEITDGYLHPFPLRHLYSPSVSSVLLPSAIQSVFALLREEDYSCRNPFSFLFPHIPLSIYLSSARCDHLV